VICFICQKIYSQGREITCSGWCHDKLISCIVAEFGEFKMVIRQATGIAYRVPTRDIIEFGLREVDLSQYPLWKEQDEG